MGSNEKAVKLTTYLISLPSTSTTLFLLLLISFIFGAITGLLISTDFLQNPLPFSDLFARIVNSGGDGLFLIATPAVLTAITCVLLKRGEDLPMRKSLFLAFVCAVLYGLFYFAAVLGAKLQLPFTGGGISIIFVGYGLVFALWYAIAVIVFRLRYRAFIFALIQLTYNSAFLLASRTILMGADALAITLKLYFASFVFLIAVYLFFMLINAPMRRTFGISSVDAVSSFLAQWTSRSKGLEDMFETVGEDIKTMVGVLSFKSDKSTAPKAIFVVPHVHYGPFGNLGGSEFPYLISSAFEKQGTATFVFHGTATHDFNPVSSSDVEIINKACSEILHEIKYEKANASLLTAKHESCKVQVLKVNDYALITLSRAPLTTEDVDFSLGLALRNYSLSKGLREALVVDAHNAETGEISRIESGNPLGFDYMDALGEAFAQKSVSKKLKLGVAQNPLSEFGARVGIGRNGLKVAVISLDKVYALVLLDANGIVPAFRREIIDAVLKQGWADACEVFTTDTHSVNAVNGVLNPIGQVRRDELLARVVECAEKAKQNIEDVEAGIGVKTIPMRVFGAKQSSELIGTVNAIVAIARIAVPLILIASVIIILWGVTKL
ncbi:MAG: DUF2070 family protein [Candidatus Micrarchaeota archaeon]